MINFLELLKKGHLQLLLSLLLAFFISDKLGHHYVSVFYTVSSWFMETLMFALPIVVFGFIFGALINMKRGSLLLVLSIFLCVLCSNVLAITTAYFFGTAIFQVMDATHSMTFANGLANSDVRVLRHLNLPILISTEQAMFAGIILGILAQFLGNKLHEQVTAFSNKANNIIRVALAKVFMPLLPLYVFGFCAKLSYDGVIVKLVTGYGVICCISIVLVLAYLFLLYFIGSGFSANNALSNIRKMLPAGIMGFSTMSSAATMPLTLQCVGETTGDKDFAGVVVPTTANIHMLGDDLTITLTAMAMLPVFGMSTPSIAVFLPFAFAFSFAKLSCVGVPGASVFVIFPVLEHYLHFSPDMISLMTTIYILQDPLGTCANVMGNGAFALLVQKIEGKYKSLLHTI